MVAFTGLGIVTLLLEVVPFAVFFVVMDNGGGDWRGGLLGAGIVALLAAGLNLGIAAAVNRGDSEHWRGDHRVSGTAMQSHTPVFLFMSGAAFAGWLLPWPVAVALVLAGTLAYYLLPGRRKGPQKGATLERRRRFAEGHGLRFAESVPDLGRRWNFGPFGGASTAASLNRPTLRLNGHFAGMAGVENDLPYTIVDAFEPEPWAVFRPWRWRPVTVCAVHLSGSLPNLRVVRMPAKRGKNTVAYDTLLPRFAQQILTPDVVGEMVEQDLDTFEIQGRDVLYVLHDNDYDEGDDDALNVIAALVAVLGRIDADLNPFVHGTLAPLPMR